MSSQYDPILDELFAGRQVRIAKRELNLNAFRVTYFRKAKQREREWGPFFKSRSLSVRERINPDTRIPELVIKLIDKPEKPVYNFVSE